MMQKKNKLLSRILISALLISTLGKFNLPVYAQSIEEEKKQYIIAANTNQSYDEIEEAIHDNITIDDPILSENNIAVAKLTEKEADELEKDNDLIIEEDFMLTASVATDDHETEQTTEDIIRIKKKIYEQITEEKKRLKEKEPEYEWNLKAIDVDEAIAEAVHPQEKVKVAVLDSGVDYVSGINLTGSINLVEEEQDLPDMFQDMTGHGTGIAGIISGNGETGIYGINPNAELYSVKVLDKENKAPLSRIIQGIYWCIENGINIINMSFGTPVYSNALKQAISDAYEANILMIGAAGNEGADVEYPAAFDDVMAVTATNAQAQISDFSNTGEELDIAAPGEKILTAGSFNGSVVVQGTSIAVPHVTGVASLLWEKDLTQSNEFVRQIINYSSKKISGMNECGLLDAKYALEIYDNFAETYDDKNGITKVFIKENVKKTECFEYIEDDETYAEGLWHNADHQAMVEKGNGVDGDKFSTADIAIIKAGAVYPDTAWRGKGKNSPWHGRWRYLTPDYRNGTNINYAAVIQMISKIALKNGDTSTFTDYTKFKGMDKSLFNDLKGMIKSLENNASYKAYTNKQRKLFVYGCGIHVLTDIFAHSTTDEKGDKITHDNGADMHADSPTYRPSRYKAASSAVSFALYLINAGIEMDGLDIIFALERTYTTTSKYKLINVKKYVVENGFGGHNDAILNQANINK